MKKNWIASVSAVALAVSAATQAQVLPSVQTDSSWYTDGQARLATKLARNP